MCRGAYHTVTPCKFNISGNRVHFLQDSPSAFLTSKDLVEPVLFTNSNPFTPNFTCTFNSVWVSGKNALSLTTLLFLLECGRCHNDMISSTLFAAPPTSERCWKVPTPQAMSSEGLDVVDLPTQLTQKQLLGEALYITRPLAHCILAGFAIHNGSSVSKNLCTPEFWSQSACESPFVFHSLHRCFLNIR